LKVLITGGAGFIGSHLADRLLARGDEVLVFDNFATARRDSLRPHDNLTVVDGTIVDKQLVDETWESFGPDVVAHAAASYKDPDDWPEDAATNATGTANVVKASEAASIRRLLYFQTALCYGLHPLEQPITLEHPLRPEESSYAISKTAGEYYVRLSDLEWVSLRLANAYGPRNVSGPLPTFYHRLTSGKACFVMDTRRDFIYVHDLIDLVLKAVDGEGAGGVYHASSGADYSIKELFDATVKALGIELDDEVEVRERGPDDAFTILLDPSRTRAEFGGWKPRTPLEEGVAAAIAYYEEHGIEETYTHLKMAEEKQPAQ
jgi:UDP-glucose 4-epimerase